MSQTVDEFMALAPASFPYLRRLALVEKAGSVGPDIELELCFYGAGDGCLVVRCAGVRDLVFRQPFTTDMKLHSLDVRDQSMAQLEDIRFRVHDLEQECVSFSCRTFEAGRQSG